MVRLLLAGLLFLSSTVGEAQTPPFIRSQFGTAHAQRFHIGDGIWLSIDYDASGVVSAARIAPADYLKDGSDPTQGMDNVTVDKVLETIAPGITTDKRGSGMLALLSRTSILEKTYKGCRLSRHFVAEETAFAILSIVPSCLDSAGSTALSLEARFGPPEYEQFSIAGNVDLGIEYGRNGTPAQMNFDAQKPLEAPRDITILNATVVEQLINRFAPVESMRLPTRSVKKAGDFREETVSAEDYVIVRRYRDNALIHASIAWK